VHNGTDAIGSACGHVSFLVVWYTAVVV